MSDEEIYEQDETPDPDGDMNGSEETPGQGVPDPDDDMDDEGTYDQDETSESDGGSDREDLYGALEALLFVSDEPVAPATLAEICDTEPGEVTSVLAQMQADYQDQNRGIQLREVAGGWRLYSHPAYHELIEKYILSWDTRKLSQASLEALAVIAYHQPVTRQGVNAIRGVSSDAVISSLVEKGLVRETGHDNKPGNAILYGTTRTFLEKFGLRSLRDLPELEQFAPDEESKRFIRERLSAGSLSSALDTEDELEDDISDDASLDEASEEEETGGRYTVDDASDETGASAHE